MEIKDRMEEILETLWIESVEHKKHEFDFSILKDDDVLKELMGNEYVRITNNRGKLTEKGREEARNCVRRHRLAERLFVDVIDMKLEDAHETSCRFEHLLHKGLEENICAMLGHPKYCPHGKPIPPGACCGASGQKEPKKVVMPLRELQADTAARVAYLHTQDREALKKLLAIGIFPNTKIKVIQKSPSFVFQIGRSQFAIDEEMASHIYVRKA